MPCYEYCSSAGKSCLERSIEKRKWFETEWYIQVDRRQVVERVLWIFFFLSPLGRTPREIRWLIFWIHNWIYAIYLPTLFATQYFLRLNKQFKLAGMSHFFFCRFLRIWKKNNCPFLWENNSMISKYWWILNTCNEKTSIFVIFEKKITDSFGSNEYGISYQTHISKIGFERINKTHGIETHH